MNSKSNRRDFDRFQLDLVVEVVAEDIEGEEYQEKVISKNISGGGAKFVTRQAGKYFIGQQLEITISLPGHDNVKGCMRGRATVRRIEPPTGSGIGEKSDEMGISVQVDARLYFERFDVQTPVNHGESIRVSESCQL
jgi:hypothetical protein